MIFGQTGKATVHGTVGIVVLAYFVQKKVEFVANLKAVGNQVLVVHFLGNEIQKYPVGPGQSHQQRQGIEIPLGKSRFYRNGSESQKLQIFIVASRNVLCQILYYLFFFK